MITQQELEEIGKVLEHMDTFYNEDGPQLEKLDLVMGIKNYTGERLLGIVTFEPDYDAGVDWVFKPLEVYVEDEGA